MIYYNHSSNVAQGWTAQRNGPRDAIQTNDEIQYHVSLTVLQSNMDFVFNYSMGEVASDLHLVASPVVQIVNTGLLLELAFAEGRATVLADVVERHSETHTGFS